MTSAEIKSLLDAVRDADAAEATLDQATIARVKAGQSARARLGSSMEPGALYSPDPNAPTVWAVGPDGMAVEVQPRPMAEAPSPRSSPVILPRTPGR